MRMKYSIVKFSISVSFGEHYFLLLAAKKFGHFLSKWSVCILTILAAGFVAAPAQSEELSWKLHDLVVVDPGHAETSSIGTLTQNYVLEGKVSGGHENLVADGKVRILLSSYSPSANSATQRVGHWYVKGVVSLIDTRAPVSVGGRYPPGTLTARLKAELAFDPLTSQKLWHGQLTLPMTRFTPAISGAMPQPIRGEGQVFIGGDSKSGNISLSIKLWSNLQEKNL